MGQFGDKFRKEREKKGFSLDDVANVTKIGTRMLQAIENERFDQLPGGVFNKGFIRTYAKHLGMNDEQAVAAYLACQRTQVDAQKVCEPERPVEGRSAQSEKRESKDQSKTAAKIAAKKLAPTKVSPGKAALKTRAAASTSTQVEELPDLQLPRAEDVRPARNKYLEPRDSRIPWRILAAAAVVIVVTAVLWYRHSRSPRTQAASASPAKPVVVTQSAPAPVLAPANQTAAARSVSAAGSHPSGPNARPLASTQPATAVRPSVPAKPVADAAQNEAGSAQPAGSTLPASPTPPLTLIIRASENSWISVLADGHAVSEETLIAPAHTSIHASREIVVKAGNAAGVSFLWNGKEVPAEGAEAEVRTFVFDSTGMRTLSAAQPPAQN